MPGRSNHGQSPAGQADRLAERDADHRGRILELLAGGRAQFYNSCVSQGGLGQKQNETDSGKSGNK
jgi:hypothetical protein